MRQERHGPFRYCTDCDYKSRKANTLSMHVSRKHSNEQNHFCPICPDAFPTQTQLGHHLVNKHSDATINCADKLCKLRFKNTTTQKTHYVRCHMDKKFLYIKKKEGRCKCISCGDISSLNAIIYHVSGCSPLSPFNKTNLLLLPIEPVVHLAACHLCPESFPTEPQLAHHLVTSHPGAMRKCRDPNCNKEFKTTKSWKMHYFKKHRGYESLYIKNAEDNSCKCISCENVFTLGTIMNHVAKCSDLSPSSDTPVLCVPIATKEADNFVHNGVDSLEKEDEMVLNQEEADNSRSFGEDSDEFPEISDEMMAELLADM